LFSKFFKQNVSKVLYSTPNIIRVIKSRRIRWAGHVAHMGGRRGAYRFLMRKPEGSKHLEDPGVNGMIILNWIFKKWNGGMDWSNLVLYRDWCCALVKAIIKLRVP
jgi:hypothetical protein